MPYAPRPVAGTQIYYEVHGDGPPVVLVPGGGGNHASWWQQIPHFQSRYTLILIDWPGYGLSRSEAEQFDITEWPDAILAVLDDLGIGRAAVVAQSLGGMPTLLFAVQHPGRVAGLVLNSSVGSIRDEAFRAVWLADRTEADRAPARERLIFHESQTDSLAKSVLFRALSSFNQARPAGGNIVNQRGDQGASFAELRELAGRGVPLWFLWGDGDRTRKPAIRR